MRIAATTVLALTLSYAAAEAAPEGQVAWAVHVTVVPTWFDPDETSGIMTPLMLLHALHDALVKPMPGQPMAPSLAESWTTSQIIHGGLGVVANHPYSAPYDDLTLTTR